MQTLLSFRTTFEGILQIFLLAAIGFILVKRRFISEDGLSLLSRLVIEVTLPLLIFCQLIERFSFSEYPKWWIFPLLSLVITAAGFFIGWLILILNKNAPFKKEFLCLLGFPNSGYLPLIMFATILPAELSDTMFNYLFLFLVGFNLTIWSFGVWFLTNSLSWKQINNFELGSLFSPPVIAALSALFLVMLGLNKFIPSLIVKPLKMVGESALPLAMLVVGGNLAQIKIFKFDKMPMLSLVLAKLILLPLLALIILFKLKVNPLVGLLIIMQAAMPPATSLSLIARHYKIREEFINQGVFITHIVSLITIPLFLGLYGRL